MNKNYKKGGFYFRTQKNGKNVLFTTCKRPTRFNSEMDLGGHQIFINFNFMFYFDFGKWRATVDIFDILQKIVLARFC